MALTMGLQSSWLKYKGTYLFVFAVFRGVGKRGTPLDVMRATCSTLRVFITFSR